MFGPQVTSFEMLQLGAWVGSCRVLMYSVSSSKEANQPTMPATIENQAKPMRRRRSGVSALVVMVRIYTRGG